MASRKNYVKMMTEQLGMHPITARSRLASDLLFSMIQRLGIKCFRCGGEMTRQTYSVEHKKPWFKEPNAAELYFDLDNISFSHLACNCGAARKPSRKKTIEHGKYTTYCRGTDSKRYKNPTRCRCDLCRKAWNDYKRSIYTPEKRNAKYRRTGT